jgi:hypothetical protein
LKEGVFFGDGVVNNPESLLPKGGHELLWIGSLLLLNFILLSSVRLNNGRAYVHLFKLLNSTTHVDDRLKETYRLESFVNVGLLLNFLISQFVCAFYVSIDMIPLDWSISIISSALIVSWMFVMQSLLPRIIGWLIGESLPQRTILANTFVGFHFFGILFAFIGLVWYLNPQFKEQLSMIVIVLFNLMNLVRVIKNSIVVIGAGVSWYYIILYFCTLEILPLFVAYHYVEMNLGVDF